MVEQIDLFVAANTDYEEEEKDNYSYKQYNYFYNIYSNQSKFLYKKK